MKKSLTIISNPNLFLENQQARYDREIFRFSLAWRTDSARKHPPIQIAHSLPLA